MYINIINIIIKERVCPLCQQSFCQSPENVTFQVNDILSGNDM